MPRDTVQLLEAPPDLSQPTLSGLAWLLRHKEAWPEGFQWDYRFCETCAIGLAARLWYDPAVYLHEDINWAELAFSLTFDMARTFFADIKHPHTAKMQAVTPEMVAACIESHLLVDLSGV